MPIYSAIKTYRGGFYNNKTIDGQDDRVYTAEDVRKPYDTVFSDGVLPEPDGTAGETLKVTSTGGMGIAVGKGNAKLGGAWFENTSPYNITLDVGSASTRYDCVIIRNDDNDDVREPSIYIKSLSAVPTISDLTRNEKIYEICVAYVKVGALASSISASDIVDTREDGSICNVMSGVGATVVRTYENTYFSQSVDQRTIPIGISQYDRTRDTLIVVVEGRTFTAGTNYSILSNTHIQLAIGLPVVGTRIYFQVIKSVNAAGAETVVQEVAELRKEMTANNKKLEHHYYCNGLNDNINISQIAQDYLNAGTDYGSMRLVVHGTVGVTSPYSGDGTQARNYFWFALGVDGVSNNRRIIVDFTDCNAIAIPVEAATQNTIFSGNDVHIVGANVIANQSAANTVIKMFTSQSGTVSAKNCRFWITAYSGSFIARTGTFDNCRGSVTNSVNYSYCFFPHTNGLIRINGGEYYAYTADSTAISGVLGQNGADSVSILYGVNAPTVARAGYYQTNSIKQFEDSGIVCCTDLISTLPLSVISGSSNIRGTIAKSKPGLM